MEHQRDQNPARGTVRWSPIPAIGLLVAALAVPIGAPPAAALAPPSCGGFDDDPGFGGSDVTCGPVGCGRFAELLVAGAATDKDASIAASFSCGDQSAVCGLPAPVCGAVSPGPTTYGGTGSCRAESDEFWSSLVAVACAATGGVPDEGSPEEIICLYVPDFPTCDDTMDQIHDLCAQDPDFVQFGPEVQELLFPTAFAGHHIVSMLSFVQSPDGSVASIAYDAREHMCDALFTLQS